MLAQSYMTTRIARFFSLRQAERPQTNLSDGCVNFFWPLRKILYGSEL